MPRTMKYHSLSITYKNLYLIIPLFVILVPTFPSILPELMGFQIVFIIEIIIVISCLIKGVFRPVFTTGTTFIFFYFFLSTILSLIIDTLRGVVIGSDFYELAKPIAFLLFFLFYRYSNVNIDNLIGVTQRAIIFCCIFLSVFSICAFLFPSLFRELEFFLYKRSSVPILANKAIGSFSTTYHFAFFLLLPLIYSFIGMVRYHNIKYLVFFILIFCTLLLTQSRSMYICSGVCLLICLFLPILHSTTKQSLLTFSLFLLIFAGGIYIFFSFKDYLSTSLAYAFEGFQTIIDGTNNSVNVRESQLNWAIANNSLILLGAGIGKDEIMLESFYSLYYYRYGLIGLILSLSIMFYTALKSFKIAKSYNNDGYSVFFYSLSVFYFVSPLAIMSSCHMDSPKISFLFYGIMGLIMNKWSTINKVNIKMKCL